MEKEQAKEWAEAQKIAVSVDLVEAAKKQLKFLAVVDRNRYLYEGPALQWAIYRYNAFWLPLLARHQENPVSEGPLVVPLDCEWIWHCHRLNPIRYKLDCEELYGRILDNSNVISSVQEALKSRMEEMWSKMYPEEPYELDLNRPFSEDVLQKTSQNVKFTSYDLVSAVKRQAPFSFQVSRPHMSDDLFLQEAVARYKGFLHLIRTNMKNNIKGFRVPTYDVDLIWHTHQLHPLSYCQDLAEIVGKVLQHDDTDSDRTKGKKLDTGFSGTTKQWEETFGLRYWKAGAMYRGSAPTPVTQTPFPFSSGVKEFNSSDNCNKLIQFQLPMVQVVEVLLEFVEIKNMPEGNKGNILVAFSKKQPDRLFNAKRTLSILSESGEKQVACIKCEPNGEFLFELLSCSHSNKSLTKSLKSLGSCSLSLQELVASGCQLSVDKWLSVVPVSGTRSSEPILLKVSISFTIPTTAPQVYHLVQSQPFFKSSQILENGKVKHDKTETRVIDTDGKDVFSLQMRDSMKDMTKSTPDLLKEVHCITNSGQRHTLVEFLGNDWSIKGNHGSFKLRSHSATDSHLFELAGCKMVKLFPGRRLDYEPEHCEKQRSEQDFMTAVEFSADYPYGRAAALIDFKSGTLKAMDEWIVLPGITLMFILSDILKKEGHGGFVTESGNKENLINQVTTSPGYTESVIQANMVMVKGNGETGNPEQGISQSACCWSGCDGGNGNPLNSAHCGLGGCTIPCDGCGSNAESGSRCGSRCDAGCGGGCGSCGAIVKSEGCGGGGKCDNMAKSSGFRGGCGVCGHGCSSCVIACGDTDKNGGCVIACSSCDAGGGCGTWGAMVKSEGCDGGGKCDNMVKSNGFRGGCGVCGHDFLCYRLW